MLTIINITLVFLMILNIFVLMFNISLSIDLLLGLGMIVKPGTEAYLSAIMIVINIVFNILIRKRFIQIDRWIFSEKILTLFVAAQYSALGPIFASKNGALLGLDDQVDAIIIYCAFYFFIMGIAFLFASRMVLIIIDAVLKYFSQFGSRRE